MASFCQELAQCNPKLEIRQESARKVLDGVKPDDRQNPNYKRYPRSRPRFEQNRKNFQFQDNLREKIISRVFTSTEGLPGNVNNIGSNLINLYTSLPSIGHDGMMGNIITDEEIAARWENENLGSYTWVKPNALQTFVSDTTHAWVLSPCSWVSTAQTLTLKTPTK